MIAPPKIEGIARLPASGLCLLPKRFKRGKLVGDGHAVHREDEIAQGRCGGVGHDLDCPEGSAYPPFHLLLIAMTKGAPLQARPSA